jgi:hypothetical protein
MRAKTTSTLIELIPTPQEILLILCHHLLDFPDILSRKTSTVRKSSWIKPEFRDVFIAFHMDMRWFLTVTSEEEEPIRTNSQDCGHIVKIRYVS